MLRLTYLGDRLEAYDARTQRLLADDFAVGLPFTLSLDALSRPDALTVRVYESDPHRYFDKEVPFGQKLCDAIFYCRYRSEVK